MATKWFKGLVTAASLSMVFSFAAGCSKKDSGGSPSASPTSTATAAATSTPAVKKLDPVTLNFYFVNDEPKGMKAVLDEFYNRTKDTLNTKLVFNFITFDQYKDKIALKISAGESVDGVFDAPWLSMPQMIGKGTYTNLDAYFNNDKYPGLKKAFPKEYLDNNKFIDGKKEEHLYGVPFTRAYGYLGGITIRKDLRLKYGLPEIKTIADLENFFEQVKKNEKGITPLAVNGADGGYVLNVNTPDVPDQQQLFVQAGQDVMPRITIKDGKADVYFKGEDYSNLPAPLNSKDNIYWIETLARKWYQKGYIEKDVISQKDAANFFKAGKFASIGGDSAAYEQYINDLKKNVPGADLEFVVFNKDVQDGKPGALMTGFKAWNFISIPATSKNADRVMLFFDWLYADQANHDLIEQGIEGKHWVPVGADKFKLPDGTNPGDNYTFPGYELTWNPLYVRKAENTPESVLKIDKYLADAKSFTRSPLASFSLDAEPIKSELAKVGPELKKAQQVAGLGLTDDIEGTYKQAVDNAKKMGLDKIKDEVKKQVDAYLASQKK